MTTDCAPFKYGLQALLRKRCAELDLAKEELALANERYEKQARALEAQTAQVTQLERHQRDLSRGGASIDVDERMRLHHCLRSALLQKAQQALQLEQARQHRESIIAQVRAAHQALKAIERHRQQSQEQFNGELLRKALLATDELHLSSLRSNATGRLTTRMNDIVSVETPSGS
jgi:hypothetical protein